MNYCSHCGFYREAHSAIGNHCPKLNLKTLARDGYSTHRYVSFTSKPIHLYKAGGKWRVDAIPGTPQWQRQLARQHVARLNGEI